MSGEIFVSIGKNFTERVGFDVKICNYCCYLRFRFCVTKQNINLRAFNILIFNLSLQRPLDLNNFMSFRFL